MIQGSEPSHRETVERLRIAVVTVCLNDLRGLQATFESLRIQSLAPCQWIVCDGNSVDGTRQWLESIRWPPLKWTSEPDDGIYQGMNKGLQRAGAAYVLFLNSGDLLAAPDVLEVVSNALADARDRPSLLYGDCFDIGTSGKSHFRRARPPYWVPIGMPTTHQAMYFRTNAILDGFDVRYRLSGDYALVARLYTKRRGADIQYLPKALCRFQLGGRSEQQRRSGLREDFEIRRQVLGMNFLSNYALHFMHHVHSWIKRHVPIVHQLVRYR